MTARDCFQVNAILSQYARPVKEDGVGGRLLNSIQWNLVRESADYCVCVSTNHFECSPPSLSAEKEATYLACRVRSLVARGR